MSSSTSSPVSRTLSPGTGRPLWALGMMSGTSYDAIDMACVRSDGGCSLVFGPSAQVPWKAQDRALLRAAQARIANVPTATLRQRERWPKWLEAIDFLVAERHAEAAERFMARRDAPPVTLAGFHGQTLTHRPGEGFTFQAGCPRTLHRALGVPVVHSFRAQDLLAGGQGAPLAPFFHWALARRMAGGRRTMAVLNIGGVSNITWIDCTAERPEQEGALLAFDCGPGNALIDDLIAGRTGEPFDMDGNRAARGKADEASVTRFLSHEYFRKAPPKSLDRNAFSRPFPDTLSIEDAAATLVAILARSVAIAMRSLPSLPELLCVSGGGRRNRHIMRTLRECLAPLEVVPVDSLGYDGDAIEAQAFAWLAIRARRGLALSAPGTTGCCHPVTGGTLLESAPAP